MSVEPDFVPDEDAQVQTVHAGRYAVGRRIRSYAGLAAAWGDLVER